MNPIYVPSKGRAGKSKFLARYGGCVSAVFVEPREADAYARAYPGLKLVVLPANDKGIAFVRNHILASAEVDHYWMIDDDVSKIFDAKTKSITEPLSTLLERAETAIGSYIGQGALEYQQFAWATRKAALNSYCDVAVRINARVVRSRGIQYRGIVNGKEDRDFTMQVIRAGLGTYRHPDVCFAAPKNGSNEGGLHDWYARSENELSVTRRMIELWGPDICSLNVKSDGRQDCKINWRRLRS